MTTTEDKVRELMRGGMTCPFQLFDTLYPTFIGHYSILRDKIAKVKNHGIG